MFKKLIYITIISMGLAACADIPPPQTHSTSNNTASHLTRNASLIGKWHCQAQLEENMDYHFNVQYLANGTSYDDGIITVKLDKNNSDLIWQFAVKSQNQWRIENNQYIEKQLAKPIVQLLPAKQPITHIQLNSFEQNNPDMKQVKNEILAGLNEFDDEETRSTITQLNANQFAIQWDASGTLVNRQCKRIENPK